MLKILWLALLFAPAPSKALTLVEAKGKATGNLNDATCSRNYFSSERAYPGKERLLLSMKNSLVNPVKKPPPNGLANHAREDLPPGDGIPVNIQRERYREIYRIIDSLNSARQAQREYKIRQAVINGYLPLGKLNLDLNRVIDYNPFEGFKPGIGLETSDQFSGVLRVGGFYSHSLKPGYNNLGIALTIFTSPGRNQSVTLLAEKDLRETGKVNFLDNYSASQGERFRRLSIQTLDRKSLLGAIYVARLSAGLRAEVNYNYSRVEPTVVYPFKLNYPGTLAGPFTSRNGALRLKWAPWLSPGGNNLTTGYLRRFTPTFWANIRAGQLSSGGNLIYIASELQAEAGIKLNRAIDANLRVVAGYLGGDHLPTQLYSAFGTNNRGLGIESGNNFATMRPNEFAASKFSNIFARVAFQTGLNTTARFKPTITLSTSAGWADVSDNFKGLVRTFDKGYFESGIKLGSLIRYSIFNYGIALHYRYGPYRTTNNLENWALKLGIELNI